MSRLILLLILSIFSLALPAAAQKCTEDFVKNNINSQDHKRMTTDTYFFSGALDKPIVGMDTQESKKTGERIGAERKNEKYDPLKVDRIVVAPSGDMAYSYGTGHMSFDEVKTGKHIDFTAAFLMVWRVDAGTCKVAATMYEPEGEE